MAVGTIIADGLGQGLATVTKSKDGGILTTNFEETCCQDRIRYGEFENDGPNERWLRARNERSQRRILMNIGTIAYSVR